MKWNELTQIHEKSIIVGLIVGAAIMYFVIEYRADKFVLITSDNIIYRMNERTGQMSIFNGDKWVAIPN